MSSDRWLIDACVEIGGIAECNALYTEGLRRRIIATGKAVEDMTVAELLALHRQHNAWFNQTYEKG
jgi:hypothetical protein